MILLFRWSLPPYFGGERQVNSEPFEAGTPLRLGGCASAALRALRAEHPTGAAALYVYHGDRTLMNGNWLFVADEPEGDAWPDEEWFGIALRRPTMDHDDARAEVISEIA